MSRNKSEAPIFYTYVYLNPLKPGKFTYNNFISFTHEPFYIGKGKNVRLKDHLNETLESTHNPHKYHTIQKIKRNNLVPTIFKLNFNLLEEQAFKLEKFYIKTIGRGDLKTGPLTNLTDGGSGSSGYNPTEETRRNMSKAQKGKKKAPFTDEHKKNMSIAFTGRKTSKKTKDKISRNHADVSGKNNPMYGTHRINVENPNAKKILFNGIKYDCIKEAMADTSTSYHLVRKGCSIIQN